MGEKLLLGTLPKHFSCMVASVYMRLKIEPFARASQQQLLASLTIKEG